MLSQIFRNLGANRKKILKATVLDITKAKSFIAELSFFICDSNLMLHLISSTKQTLCLYV